MNLRRLMSFLTGLIALAGVGLTPNSAMTVVDSQSTRLQGVTEQSPVFLERMVIGGESGQQLVAGHYSHSSHASHSSHQSHYSHYSGRS
uniref:Uncharacterized protein n=1 Tax=Nitratidesulfovibrio vulgaris (strain DSM 19637 / Miyazaki F) TaxID=883 RepID=B8DJ02_NITV9